MKYTEEQSLDIAKHVYDRDLTVEEAAVKYDLSVSSVEKYLRLYRAKMGLKPRVYTRKAVTVTQPIETPGDASLKEYEAMTKEELIDALVMARINEARLKKGYSVKGSGVEKEYLSIDKESTK